MSDHDSFEAKDMNARDIRRICRERGSFSVPSCTTILYLHQQKFKTVSGLEEYKACKVLHLENNCLTDVSGLSHMSSLRVLHLQSNAISSLEGLASCTRLDTLNVSGNPIRDMGSLPASLRTLRASHMGQWDASVVLQIAVGCPSLQVLDLQRDGLEGEGVVEALSRLRELRVLYLQGNPLPSLQNYRRRLVSGLPDLCYLDDRPVEDIERAGAAAWIAGGAEAERAARMAFRDAKWEQERRSVYSFARERAARRAARGAAQGARPRGVAAPAAMDSLPSEALPSAAGDCSICSEGLLKGETVTTLPCGHGFHSRCIRPWLECFSDSCPLCRQTVRTAPAQAREPPRPQTAHARRSAGRDSAARCPDAPPRCSMGASFCAADLVRSHALEDMARAHAGLEPVQSTERSSVAAGAAGGDSPHPDGRSGQRGREAKAILSRIAAKSREMEASLSAWNLMVSRRAAARAAEAHRTDSCQQEFSPHGDLIEDDKSDVEICDGEPSNTRHVDLRPHLGAVAVAEIGPSTEVYPAQKELCTAADMRIVGGTKTQFPARSCKCLLANGPARQEVNEVAYPLKEAEGTEFHPHHGRGSSAIEVQGCPLCETQASQKVDADDILDPEEIGLDIGDIWEIDDELSVLDIPYL